LKSWQKWLVGVLAALALALGVFTVFTVLHTTEAPPTRTHPAYRVHVMVIGPDGGDTAWASRNVLVEVEEDGSFDLVTDEDDLPGAEGGVLVLVVGPYRMVEKVAKKNVVVVTYEGGDFDLTVDSYDIEEHFSTSTIS